MITYSDIYEAAKKEGYSEPLQKLSKDFVEEVADYLKDKKEISSKEDDDFSDIIVKTKKQLENAQTLFKELMLKRRKKILNLILIAAETGISKKDFDNMLEFEKELFEELMKCMDSSNKKVLEVFNNNGKAGGTHKGDTPLSNPEEGKRKYITPEGQMRNPLSITPEEGKSNEELKQIVTFKENVEEFIDLEGNKLGPFKQGDEAELPKEIAKILIDDGKVEIVGKG